MPTQTDLFGGVTQNPADTGKIEHEYYPTPEGITRALLPYLHIPNQGNHYNILEPCCGAGAIAKVLERTYSLASIMGTDIIYSIEYDATDPEYWLEAQRANWVITNPPFSLASQILPLAFEHASTGVAFLLKLTYAEPTEDRALWLHQHSDHLRYCFDWKL